MGDTEPVNIPSTTGEGMCQQLEELRLIVNQLRAKESQRRSVNSSVSVSLVMIVF